ncbi:PH domain-containing protein [Prosthecobacter debontii]|uniref:PH domain-containing protein n=1 Tax=Prosthecobacter debontii TaxID=48467 RepID=A0A1T4Z443_9BACT|nr:PH domain-containing protein [Prosthecobacter debontii]SKB08800.1 PH domain-containing protein [Prosthecobacter debontii]
MRYHLHEHPAFPGLLSKDDLFLLVEQGSLARGDLCTDTMTGRDHTVGDIITGMRPPRNSAHSRLVRPAYQEIRADATFHDESYDRDEEDASPPPSSTPEADSENVDEESLTGSYTDSGELILHETHPSWISYAKAVFLAFLLFIVTAMLVKVDAFYAPFSAAAAVGVLLITWLCRMSRVYYITEERVELVWGILGRSSKEVRICDIRSIDVYERGLKGLLGLGTVDFSSAANAGIEVQFRDIRDAHRVKELVRQLQRLAKE